MLNMEYLKIFNFCDKKRLGANEDGGYIIAILNDNYDFYISAGISNEESFSRDFIKLYNMNKSHCAAFDGTINKYPTNYTDQIYFYKRNIDSFSSRTTANLSYFMNNYNNIFLKMDIEGSEYKWILSLNENQLNKFKQIVIEFHGINDNSLNININDKNKCFENLAKTHYPVHIHGNNAGKLSGYIPDIIEITYVRKNEISCPELNKEPLPINGLDFPNIPYKQDYNLNFYPFVNK